MHLLRVGVLALALSSLPALAIEPFVIKDIRVEGIQRTEAGTVFGYLPVKVGDTMGIVSDIGAFSTRIVTARGEEVNIPNSVLVGSTIGSGSVGEVYTYKSTAPEGTCIALPADISTVEGARRLAAEIAQRESALDILVNNAGAAWGEDFDTFPENGWDKVVDLNMKTPFFLTQALHAPLKKGATEAQPAKVINIASIDGIKLNPLETYSYHASKAALIYLTRRMAATIHRDRRATVAP